MVTDVNSGFCYYRNSLNHSNYLSESSLVYISRKLHKTASKVPRNHGTIIVETLGDLKRKATQLSEKLLQDTSVKRYDVEGHSRCSKLRLPASGLH